MTLMLHYGKVQKLSLCSINIYVSWWGFLSLLLNPLAFIKPSSSLRPLCSTRFHVLAAVSELAKIIGCLLNKLEHKAQKRSWDNVFVPNYESTEWKIMYFCFHPLLLISTVLFLLLYS